MKALLLNDVGTRVWLLLAGLTGLTWWLGAAHGLGEDANVRAVTISLLVLAFFKVRLVIMYFMEVRTAPLPLRVIFESWVVIVCAVVVAIYWVGGRAQ